MKIAVITDDGKTISQHFGRAQYYFVITIEDKQVIHTEMREKLGHVHFANEPHEAEVPGQRHGFDPASQNRHARMAQTINDCEAVLCRGMGMGAYESLKGGGIRAVVTDIELVDDAIQAYIEGRIVDHIERLH
jgi:predicted Fe-Mo cluster-binding NifX family protein